MLAATQHMNSMKTIAPKELISADIACVKRSNTQAIAEQTKVAKIAASGARKNSLIT